MKLVKIKDALGNFIYLNPKHVICLARHGSPPVTFLGSARTLDEQVLIVHSAGEHVVNGYTEGIAKRLGFIIEGEGVE